MPTYINKKKRGNQMKKSILSMKNWFLIEKNYGISSRKNCFFWFHHFLFNLMNNFSAAQDFLFSMSSSCIFFISYRSIIPGTKNNLYIIYKSKTKYNNNMKINILATGLEITKFYLLYWKMFYLTNDHDPSIP